MVHRNVLSHKDTARRRSHGFVRNGLGAQTLAGDTVSIKLTESFLTLVNQQVIVGNGEEANYNNALFFDLNYNNGNIFSIRANQSYSSIYGAIGRPTFTLSDLNFGSALTSFTVLQSIAPVTINSLTSTSVTFSYDDVAIPQGVFFQGRFGVAATAVPGPLAGAGLVPLLGFAGAWLARRRNQKTAG